MIGRGIGIPFRHGTGGGTSIPPEIKKNIIAWYDPKKQGMTNYDVIEAYIEDFTKWAYRNYRGTAKITNNTIVITNVVETNNIVEDDKEPYSDLTIRVTGVTENKYLIVRQGRGKPETYIKKDGVYTFKDNNLYFGFGVSVIGECNITITQLPTSILKDFSGNGNHAYLYGGKGNLNSGMGLYKVDFTSWRKSSVQTEVKPDVVKVTPNTSNYLFIQYASSVEIPSYKIKVIGLGDNVLKYQYATENGRKEINIVEGENELPTSIKVSNDYQIGYRLTPGTSVFTITQIPDYPDQLCYDGKMYAVAYDMPILTDYTVMAERTWFERQNRACFLSKITTSGTGAFGFEFYNEYNEDTTYSFGRANNVEYFKDGITYQITNSYNGIVKLDYIVNGKDNAELYIGKLRSSERNAFIGCHGAIIIADRSFTEEEINWLKNNLFTIDIPTPAYDFDFSKYKDGSNLGDSITDKYGNVLELHNFAWKGMSGLGGYPIDLKATFPRNYTDGRDYICNDKEITCSYIGRSGLFQVLMVNQDITKYIEIPEFTIKISGSENINLTYHYIKEDFTKGLLNIVGNGIYKIPKSYKADKIVENLNWLGFVLQNHMNENVDLKLEILPIYPGALVFDGIDDYARLAKMTIKTVVLDVIPKKQTTVLYDNRLNAASNWFSILNGENEIIAYNSHNDGFTYINGELNTTVKPNEIMNEKNVICVVNEKSEKANQFIGTSISLSGNANMVLYRITGFTEALTTDQVWKWYQKNKPKGGDK
mgnify:CR=1 FL=1